MAISGSRSQEPPGWAHHSGGSITEFAAGITAGAAPNAIASGPDGNLWFSESTGNRIARIGSGVDVLVRAPAVYGAGRVAERALCDEGAWKASLDIGTYAIQWTRDGADLAGATGGVYTPVAGDEGHLLACRVAARSASVLALYSAQSSAIAVGGPAVGPAGLTGPTGQAAAASPAGTGGAAGTSGASGASGVKGAPGARGAAATAGATAALLHVRLTTVSRKGFTVRYLAAKGMRLVLMVRRRSGLNAVRLATLTTRKSGRGGISVRHALAPGAYTLVLTTIGAGSARVVDTIPFVVRKA